jgi:hypothetical protein
MSIEVTPILPRERPTALAVTFIDIPVPNPHLVNFELRNVGPRDVPSTAFDAAQPLKVHFPAAIYGVTRAMGRVVYPAIGERPPKAIVSMEPRLIKRGESWGFTAVVSGGQAPRVESSLVDTDIVQTAPGPAQTVRVEIFGVGVALPLPRRKLRLTEESVDSPFRSRAGREALTMYKMGRTRWDPGNATPGSWSCC